MLSQHQKDSIMAFRYEGCSYQTIADTLNLSANTVKSFCRRNTLKTTQDDAATENICKNCGTPLVQTAGAKPKIFCSDNCRYAWWNRQRSRRPYQLTCCHCGRMFISFGNRKRKFCGRECYNLSRYGEGLP